MTYRRNYYKKYGRLTEQYPGIPQGYDYTIYKEGDYVVAKNGKTGEIEFSDSRADDLVQQVVSKLEEERFSQHLGATIKFDLSSMSQCELFLDAHRYARHPVNCEKLLGF